MDPKTWLSPEELASVTQRSDLKGAVLVASQWLQVLALFVVMAAYPHPLVWVLGTMLLQQVQTKCSGRLRRVEHAKHQRFQVLQNNGW